MKAKETGRARFKERLEGFLRAQKTIGKFTTLAIIKSLDEDRKNLESTDKFPREGRPDEISGSELKKKTESNLSILMNRPELPDLSNKISNSTFYDIINRMANDSHQLLHKREVKVGKKKRKIITKYRLNLDVDSFGPIFIENEEEAERILENIDDKAYFDFGDDIFSKSDLLKDKSIAFLNLPDQVRACAFDIKSKDVISIINSMPKVNSFGIINLFHGEGYVDRPFSAQRLLAYRLIVEGMKILSEIQNELNFEDSYFSGSKSFMVSMRCDPDTDFNHTLREFDYFSHNGNFENHFEPVSTSISELHGNFTPDYNYAWVSFIVNGEISYNSKQYLNKFMDAPSFNSKDGIRLLNEHIEDMKGLTHEFARCIIEICYNNLFYQVVFESQNKDFDWEAYLENAHKMDMKMNKSLDGPKPTEELHDKLFWNNMLDILEGIIPLIQSNKIEEISIFPEPKEVNNVINHFSITYNAGTTNDLKQCILLLNSTYGYE